MQLRLVITLGLQSVREKMNSSYDCELWDKGSETIVLNYVEEDYVDNITEIARCLKALKELESFVKPLSMEIEFMCSHRKHGYFDYKLRLSQPIGHLEITPLPTEVYIDRNDLAKIKAVSDITNEAVNDLVKELLQQKCSNPDFEPSWSVINIKAVRAKITEKSKSINKDGFAVESPTGKLKFPLIRHGNSLWVYAPKNIYRSYPPISIRFVSEGGAHTMSIYVAWSMWYDSKSSGYKELYEAVQRIVAQGWKLTINKLSKKPEYAA